MNRKAWLALSFLVVGCADGADSTPADGGAEVDYGDGPWTGRPDDGLDTSVADGPSQDASNDGPGDSADAASVPDVRIGDAKLDASAASAARINEVYVDRALDGDAVEWVELSAAPGTTLTKLHLRALDETGKILFDLPVADAGAMVGTSGLWVIGGPSVSLVASGAKVDKTYSHITDKWGLSNSVGTIQLIAREAAGAILLDVLGYGGTPTAPATEPTKTVEGAAAKLPPSGSGSRGQTIGRSVSSGDTDDNGADFCPMAGTPGAKNGACL